MVDTHCHLDLEPLAYHEAEAVARAKQAGVKNCLTIGVDLDSSERARRIAHKVPGVYAAVGIHPSAVTDLSMDMIARLKELADDDRVVAIGEIGLDYYQLEKHPKEMPSKMEQLRAFDQLMSLAQDVGRPVIVHARGAVAEALEIVKGYQPEVSFVFHSFDGTAEEAALIIQAGGYIGVNNLLSYPKNDPLRQAIAGVPLDRLLLETDAPFLPPQDRRGTPSEPADVTAVAKLVAEIHQTSVENVSAVTDRTVSAIFSI